MTPEQDTVPALYRKLIALYPRAFGEQLGESMAQTFNDVYREQQYRTQGEKFGLVLGMFLETFLGILVEYRFMIQKRSLMQNILSNPKSSALISLLLALPCAVLFIMLVFHIEPNFGPLQPLLENPNVDGPDAGSFIALGAFLLLIPAFFIARAPIARALRSGGNWFTYPLNMVFAVAIFVLFATIVGAIIVDKYPCWVGVPNCD